MTNYPLKAKLEAKFIEMMTAYELIEPKVGISDLTQEHIHLSTIAFGKNDMQVELKDLDISARSLPYMELLQKNYANVAANWTLGEVKVSGIPYDLPPLSGEGVLYVKDNLPVINGVMKDAKNTHRGEFTVTSKAVLLENVSAQWQGATLNSKEVLIELGKPGPIDIPLVVKNLPLSTLLSMMSGEKATGSGTVSGNIDVTVNPDGTFGIGKGVFSTVSEGQINVQADALPGDQPQMEIARTALSNFHYKELKITTSDMGKGKTGILLTIEGNNPEAFDGRPVKLNVNLTGDLLGLIQQSVMPLMDPNKLIEKETK